MVDVTFETCMSTQVSPLPEAGPNLCTTTGPRISTNWFEITFEGFDSYVDPLNEDHRLDWLQSGVGDPRHPKQHATKVPAIQ